MQVHSSGVSDRPISENRKIRQFGEQETLPANQRGRETNQSGAAHEETIFQSLSFAHFAVYFPFSFS